MRNYLASIFFMFIFFVVACTEKTLLNNKKEGRIPDAGQSSVTSPDDITEESSQGNEESIWDFAFDCAEQKCPHLPISGIFEWSGKQISDSYYYSSNSNLIVDGENIFFAMNAKSVDPHLLPSTQSIYYSISVSGKLNWETKIPHSVGGSLSLTKNGVLISMYDLPLGGEANNDFKMHAFRAKDGKKIWTHQILHKNEKRSYSSASTVGNMVVIGGPKLVALHEFSGAVLWEADLSEPGQQLFFSFDDKPVIGKEHIYVFSSIGNVLAFDFQGKKQWSFSPHPDEKGQGAITIGKDGHLFISTGRVLFSLTKEGKLRWKSSFPAYQMSIDKDGSIYVITPTSPFYASFTSNGKKRWNGVNGRFGTYGVEPPITFDDCILYMSGTGGVGLVDFNGKLKQPLTGYDKVPFLISGTNFIEKTGQLVTSFRDPRIPYELNPTKDTPKQRILIILIDIGKKKLDGYWPMRFHDSRNSSSVE